MSSKSSAKKNKPVPGAARRAAGRGKTAGSGSTPTPGDRLPIVGLGASAGGLEALRAFFGAMPAKTGLSFVVVVHLDPTHESLMLERAQGTGVILAVRDIDTDHPFSGVTQSPVRRDPSDPFSVQNPRTQSWSAGAATVSAQVRARH